MRVLPYLFVTLLSLVSCSETKMGKEKQDILISNISIVEVSTGELLESRYVIIDSGRIKRISAEKMNSADFVKLIDGTGKYLMPGLAEMHAHIPPPTTSRERLEETLFLYLSNGITTIRGMLGDPLHLQLKKQAHEGTLLSPRIYVSSPSLNGTSVKTKEEAIQKVTQYKKEGYDFLKIHPGIKRTVFNQVVETADELNIPFAGHVPVAVGIRHALESNYASIDHVDGFLEGLVPMDANVSPDENGFFGYDFAPLADTTKIDELVALAKKHKVWIVPTQSLFERWFAPISAEELLQQPEMEYMPATTLAKWKSTKESYMQDESFNNTQWQQFNGIRKKLIKKLQDNGHGMLLGSDAPQLFNVPGFSIHHEMEGMQNAGLTPLEIIKSGTINPAIYFDALNEFGQVKEGLSADLIILDKNPLENLSAFKQINGVLVKGQWLSKQKIEEKLNNIAENAVQN